MKKIKICLLILVVLLFCGFAIYATTSFEVTAINDHFPIVYNGEGIDVNNMLVYEDRVYLPLREMCEVLKIDIEWNEQHRTIVINDDFVYKSTKPIISSQTAIRIAEAHIEDRLGSDFMEKTAETVIYMETDNVYIVCRMPEKSVLGGGCTVVIAKEDGRIIDLTMDE